jgi:nitrite reductase (cytochrome c-552)
LNVNRSCQTCHHFSEDELKSRVDVIQERNFQLLQRAGSALMGQIDAIAKAKAQGVPEEQLVPALELQRQAQWRIDYVAAENSMGFHAPQEAARVLGEAIDSARQGEIAALRLAPEPPVNPSPSAADSDAGEGAAPATAESNGK